MEQTIHKFNDISRTRLTKFALRQYQAKLNTVLSQSNVTLWIVLFLVSMMPPFEYCCVVTVTQLAIPETVYLFFSVFSWFCRRTTDDSNISSLPVCENKPVKQLLSSCLMLDFTFWQAAGAMFVSSWLLLHDCLWLSHVHHALTYGYQLIISLIIRITSYPIRI